MDFQDVYQMRGPLIHADENINQAEQQESEASSFLKVRMMDGKALDKGHRKMLKQAEKLSKTSADHLKKINEQEMMKSKLEPGTYAYHVLEVSIKEEQIKRISASTGSFLKKMMAFDNPKPVITRIELDSLKRILKQREAIITIYAANGEFSVKHRANFEQHQKLYVEEMERLEKLRGEYDLQMKTVRALDEEKRQAQVEQKLPEKEKNVKIVREFLKMPFRIEDLRKEYVYDNIGKCIHIIKLIEKAKSCKGDLKQFGLTEDESKIFEVKLDALNDYGNHIRELVLKQNIDICSDDLKVRQSPEMAESRRSYLNGGYIRLESGIELYNKVCRQGVQAAEEARKKTTLENRLSYLETQAGLDHYEDEQIAREISRPFRSNGQKEEILVKADFENVLGSKHRVYEKDRLYRLFYTLQEKLNDPLFDSLETYIGRYTLTNRKLGEDRKKFQIKENKMLADIKNQLVKISGQVSGETLRYVNLLQSMILENTNGMLRLKPDVKNTVYGDEQFQISPWYKNNTKRKWSDRRDMPLFPHAPTIKDISQGGVGDCYLMAAMISVLNTTPEVIKECMRDNGDGTVTVRFFDHDEERTNRTPIYITVSKTVPVAEFDIEDHSIGCLWMQMLRKAYAASGLHVKHNKNSRYRDAKKISYGSIEAGESGVFLYELLEGEAVTHREVTDVKKEIAEAHEIRPDDTAPSMYTATEEKTFQRIQAALDAKKYVMMYTRAGKKGGKGLNGESMLNGMMVAGHAFSILNTATRVIHAREHKFLVIMNPWAHTGIQYEVERNGHTITRKSENMDEGVFYMDLADISKYMWAIDEVGSAGNPT